MKRRTHAVTPPTDEELVDQVDAITGGRYLHHIDTAERPAIQREVDKLLAHYGFDIVDLAQARCRITLAAGKSAGAEQP